jgi:hypothetical protein
MIVGYPCSINSLVHTLAVLLDHPCCIVLVLGVVLLLLGWRTDASELVRIGKAVGLSNETLTGMLDGENREGYE